MCKFCENIDWNTFRIEPRSTYADDNCCDLLSPELYETFNDNGEAEKWWTGVKCDGCEGCANENSKFTMTLFDMDKRQLSKKHTVEAFISLAYIHQIRGIHIMPYSESIRINFCPWCGKQISNEIIEFEKVCYIKPEEVRNDNG